MGQSKDTRDRDDRNIQSRDKDPKIANNGGAGEGDSSATRQPAEGEKPQR